METTFDEYLKTLKSFFLKRRLSICLCEEIHNALNFLVRNKCALRAYGFACAVCVEQHIALAQQLLGAGCIEYYAGINA